MKKALDSQLRRDVIKVICVIGVLVGTFALFFLTPALSTPMFLSLVAAMMLSPWVATLERRGYPHSLSILLVFGTLGLASVLSGIWTLQRMEIQWDSLKGKAPLYFDATISKLQSTEAIYRAKFPLLEQVNITQSIIDWVQLSGNWFVTNGTGLVGDLLGCLFLVPIFTFVILSDGRTMQKKFFALVPNRFFESFFLITNEISASLSDYLRAKLVEAFLVGLMTWAGLAAFGAPYALVLAVAAGVTNILPYIGPVLGAVPAILVPLLDPAHAHLLWPIALVILVVNVIDMVVIFPLIVAKLVNLHPLVLIAVVALGQKYYGLVGMLISIPLASAAKVIMLQLHTAVYEQRTRRLTQVPKSPPTSYQSAA